MLGSYARVRDLRRRETLRTEVAGSLARLAGVDTGALDWLDPDDAMGQFREFTSRAQQAGPTAESFWSAPDDLVAPKWPPGHEWPDAAPPQVRPGAVAATIHRAIASLEPGLLIAPAEQPWLAVPVVPLALVRFLPRWWSIVGGDLRLATSDLGAGLYVELVQFCRDEQYLMRVITWGSWRISSTDEAA